MALDTFNLPGKNVPADKQMAMMRTYLESLKDDIEKDLYNIDWNNFSKPLREKLEGFDKELINTGDIVNSIQANYVSTQYLETNYLTAQQISSTYVTTQYLTSNYITASTISSTYVTSQYLTSNYITASTISSTYVTSQYLTSNYITASTISSTYLEATAVTSDYIAGKFIAGNGSKFGKINTEDLAIVIGGIGYDVTFRKVQKYGGSGYEYALVAESTPPV